MKRESDREYKDKVRHGGRRKELLKENGFKCSKCGKTEYSFNIVAHHTTFDSKEHEYQELLCRSCHAKIHSKERKPLSKEDIKKAITSTLILDDAAKKLGITRSNLRKRRIKFNLQKLCFTCKSFFVPTPKLRRYCSNSCADIGKKLQRRKRDISYKETKKRLDREYYQRNKERILLKLKSKGEK